MTASIDICLPDGTVLQIRQLNRCAVDAARALDFAASCSESDRRQRFGIYASEPSSVVPWLLPRTALDRAVAVCDPVSPAVAAVVNLNAVSRSTWEVAALVGPDWRGRGVAQAVLGVLMRGQAARYVCVIDRDNLPALRLRAKVVPDARAVSAGGSIEFQFAAGVGREGG